MCLFLCSCMTKWGGKEKRVRDLCGASRGQSGHVTRTDLLRVTVCERQFSCNMKHDFSPMKGSVDCFTSCLTVTHVQSSSEPEDRDWGHKSLIYYTCHLSDKMQSDFTRWSLAAGPSLPEQTGTLQTPRSPRCYWVCPPRWPTERLRPSDRSWCGAIFLTPAARSHTCPSFWHKMPNLKLRDTLCSSKVVMSSGAWGMSETEIWEDPAEINAPHLIFIANFRGLPWGSRPLQNLRRSLGRRASTEGNSKNKDKLTKYHPLIISKYFDNIKSKETR